MGEKNCGQSKKRICGAGHDGRKKPERAVPQIRHQPSNRLQVARAVQRRRDDARPAAHAVPEAFQNQSGCGAADRGCAGRTSNVGRSENPTFLVDKGENSVPAASTINDILKRNGCISELASGQHTPWKRFARDRPNALWQMDYKGHFGMTNGQRCHGLTILDDHSRFSPVPRREGKRTMGGHKGQSGPRFRGIRNSRRDFVRQRRTLGRQPRRLYAV